MIIILLFLFACICAQEISTAVRLGTFKPNNVQTSLLPTKMADCEFEVRSGIREGISWWANANYVCSTIKSPLGNPITFGVVPVSVGVKYEYELLEVWAPYIGVGLSGTYGYLSETKAPKHPGLHEWWCKLGYVVKCGLHCMIFDSVTFDIFTDRYADFSPNHYGGPGWRRGAGIRFNFDY